MSKIRIYELAKQLGVANKDLVAKINSIGIEAKSHMAMLTEEEAAKVTALYQPKKEEPKKDAPKKDAPKQNQPKQNQPKQNQPKQDGQKKENDRRQDGNRPAQKKDNRNESRSNESRSNESRNENKQGKGNNNNNNNKQGGQNNKGAQQQGKKDNNKGKDKKDKKGNKNGQKVRENPMERRRREMEEEAALMAELAALEAEEANADPVIKYIPESITVKDLAEVLGKKGSDLVMNLMKKGKMLAINATLDFDTAASIAEEYNVILEQEEEKDIMEEAFGAEEEEDESKLEERPPVVVVMGHVDHGKTSLLDAIRHSSVTKGEAGGITQHIGAYNVKLEDGRRITFLDTPGHEAFTAMRARGAQMTDIAIIIVAADDNVMPQTVEAINHASAAGVPIVFAINKIDKPNANPDKIKEELANMNYLVEDWGGKYQSQEISAKKGTGVHELMEKVLLEAELLDLKANPNRRATGSIIESTLDKGRGYVATVLVQNGTLHKGDVVLAGTNHGKVKAMFNERNARIEVAGPSAPVQILGLNGAPQAGDVFHVMDTEQEAREIANKREQLQRELGLRTHKLLTLDDIGRRIAVGNFQELNLVVKGDVDGSVEALSDSLIKLSTPEIQINVLHKAVGQISESDITLAAASNAIIIGFQVRPSVAARRLAEKEGVDIRLYSIIYDAIEEVKSAMEGMLSPEIKEEILGTAEVLETYHITKVGTVAGCIVKEGKLKRSSKIRLIRDGIVIYSGDLGSLKRFKDDVKEVTTGFECGLNITNYNDVKIGDLVEAYEEVEVKKTL